MSPLFLDRWWRFHLRILNGTKKRNTDTTTASASTPRELVRQRAGSGEVFTRLSRGRTRLSPFAPGSLEKIGRGALRLSGENIYAGGTTIEGGTLLVAIGAGPPPVRGQSTSPPVRSAAVASSRAPLLLGLARSLPRQLEAMCRLRSLSKMLSPSTLTRPTLAP